MRHLAITVFVLAAGTAQAQSVTPLVTKPEGASSSLVTKSCESCPPLVKEQASYKVPTLRGGVQSVSVVDIDGEKKIVRTDRLMGGSPVVYISKVPDWMTVDQLQAVIEIGKGKHVQTEVQLASQQQDPIDLTARTGAVETGADSANKFDAVPLRLK
ncbi:plant virulence effector HPE1-like domain-containing protein [Neorhizobium sp. NCHU2750]|uniref:plant virulence effector HPE1-like domain-containing protein n=1 Tax=Neorhizobium sp. NCHU2750 TaxID=1825976 RepID=UPI000E720B76|nr:hypothetical protein NCHU2750_04540 [Neorhizobium sp. NCHU2750]